MFFLKASLLFILFASPVAALDNQQDWELVKQENGIIVYTRTLAGSYYKEFRGEMDLNTNIDELLAFIKDDEHCPRWRYKCIEMLNLSDGYIYKLSNLPWPFSNRYTVMQSETHYDKQDNSYTIRLKNIQRSNLPQHIQAQLPAQENTVQMRYSDGFWKFKPATNKDKIHIIYQMHGDADAPLPSELTRRGIINSAFMTLSNLKKHFIRKYSETLPKN